MIRLLIFLFFDFLFFGFLLDSFVRFFMMFSLMRLFMCSLFVVDWCDFNCSLSLDRRISFNFETNLWSGFWLLYLGCTFRGSLGG